MDPKKDHPHSDQIADQKVNHPVLQNNETAMARSIDLNVSNIQVPVFHCDQCDVWRIRQHELLPKALWSSATHTINYLFWMQYYITTVHLWAFRINTYANRSCHLTLFWSLLQHPKFIPMLQIAAIGYISYVVSFLSQVHYQTALHYFIYLN